LDKSKKFSEKLGRKGFEPLKAKPVDLQSTPFDRFGTYPYYSFFLEKEGSTRMPMSDILVDKKITTLCFFYLHVVLCTEMGP